MLMRMGLWSRGIGMIMDGKGIDVEMGGMIRLKLVLVRLLKLVKLVTLSVLVDTAVLLLLVAMAMATVAVVPKPRPSPRSTALPVLETDFQTPYVRNHNGR